MKNTLAENMLRFNTKNLSKRQQALLLNEAAGVYSPWPAGSPEYTKGLKWLSKADYDAWLKFGDSLTVPNLQTVLPSWYIPTAPGSKTFKLKDDISTSYGTYSIIMGLKVLYMDCASICSAAGLKYIPSDPATIINDRNANHAAIKQVNPGAAQGNANSYTNFFDDHFLARYFWRPDRSIKGTSPLWRLTVQNVLGPHYAKACATHCVKANKPLPPN
jgi:hypothetical protein